MNIKTNALLLLYLGFGSWLIPISGVAYPTKKVEQKDEIFQAQISMEKRPQQLMNKFLVEMTFRGFGVSGFPIERSFFDIILRNPYSEPRWFVLPRKNIRLPQLTKLRLKNINILRLTGYGDVWICELEPQSVYDLASPYNTLWALKLPAASEVNLRRFEFSPISQLAGYDFSSTSPPPAFEGFGPKEIAIARELLINGTPYELTMRINLMSDLDADVIEKPVNDMISRRAIPETDAIFASLVDVEKIDVQVNYPSVEPR
jgi:hypothetical protein